MPLNNLLFEKANPVLGEVAVAPLSLERALHESLGACMGKLQRPAGAAVVVGLRDLLAASLGESRHFADELSL
jgi:hypothetical protein